MNYKTTKKLKFFAFWLVITAVGIGTSVAVLRMISPSQQFGYSIATMILVGFAARILRPQTFSGR